MTTLRATYALYVDWNDDGDFDDAGEDISADWIRIAITSGYSSPFARYPTVGRMTVLLKNAAKTYSPPETATARPRLPVKLTMAYGGTTKTIFTGWIQTLRPDYGSRLARRAVMECVDAIWLLDQFDGEIALMTNTYADDIITRVVDAVYTPPATAYQNGINLFPTAADRWTGQLVWALTAINQGAGVMQRVNASGKIQDACTSDWGRFFVSKAGVPTYYNRHKMPFDSTTALTLDDDMVGLDYGMSADDVRNYIEVTCHPRKIGEVNEVLGQLDQNDAPMIEDGASVTFDIAFRDPANNAVQLGGLSVVTPVATTDFAVTDDEAGEGTDDTASITPAMTAYGDHAEITLNNAAGHPVWVQTLRVRGLAVRSSESVTVVASEASDVVQRLRVDAALMSSAIDAQSLAAWLLSYYKDPLHNIQGVTIFANSTATLMAAVRDLELMNRVVITEGQTGLSAQAGYIYAMRHTIERGRIHRLEFNMEQAYDYGADPFTIDTSRLDGADVLVY